MNADQNWPEGAQAAVAVTVNYDGESVERAERGSGALWGRHSYGRYGTQAGTPRILDLLELLGIESTFFVPGWDVERNTELVREIRDRGHEIAGHGYLHEDFSQLEASEQERALERSEAAFDSVLQIKPSGWRAPHGLMTAETRALLARRGYSYDSSYCDDDLPYRAETADGAGLIEIPVFQTASDSHYYRLRRSPEVVERALRYEFETVYQAGGLLNLTLHPRGDFGSGRAVRLRAIEALLRHIQRTPNVWWANCRDVANWAAEAPIITWPV
jgi:peptidoglycan/xylan/chitin deacetylase (PgdA/CDA1 family)